MGAFYLFKLWRAYNMQVKQNSDNLPGVQRKDETDMIRLDETIADVAYILDSLTAYRRIVQAGCCNSCMRKDCEYLPDPGQLVRYNCPFYERTNK